MPSQGSTPIQNQKLTASSVADNSCDLWVCDPVGAQYISVVAVLLGAFLATWWAQKTIKAQKDSVVEILEQNRMVTKQRCTIDYLRERSSDDRFVGAMRLLSAMHDARNIDLKCLARPEDLKNPLDFSGIQDQFVTPINYREAKSRLSYLLNKYEYLAVAVQHNIYDQEMLKKAAYTSTIQTWDRAEVYIKECRQAFIEKNPGKECTFYKEYESLIGEWS